jgi:aryl-alcohol dehydrogenase-like predicted oxidoreductase
MSMERRILGKTGYEVSEIGLGCWQLGGDFGPVGDQEARDILGKARKLDVTFWDTADVYGGGQSETRIGEFNDKKGVVVATKVGRNDSLFPNKYSRRNVKDSIAGSIQRLGVETLDLVQLHTIPTAVMADGEIFNVMDDLRDEGLMRHYGASVESVEEGLICLRHEGVASLQIIYNLFRQDAATELLPKAQKQNVGIIVRLPLASGLLAGKYSKQTRFTAQDHRTYNREGKAFFVGETFSGLPFETGVDLADELKKMGPKGLPLSQFALRWLLDQPAVSTVIAGVTKPAQLEDNVAATRRDPLDPDLVEELRDWYERKVRPHVRGHI